GKDDICIPSGRYRTTALTVPNTVTRIRGEGELVQFGPSIGDPVRSQVLKGNPPLTNAGGLLNVINHPRRLTIEGLTFAAQTLPPGSPDGVDTGNTAIYALGSNDLTVRGNWFSGWRLHAVYVQKSTDVHVIDNHVSNVANGIRFTGVRGGGITGNTLE